MRKGEPGHPNAAAGVARANRERAVGRRHEAGLDPRTIARQTGYSAAEVAEHLRALGLVPRPVVGVRILSLLAAFPPLSTPALARLLRRPHRAGLFTVHKALARLHRDELVARLASTSGRRVVFWTLPERLPMTLESAQELLRRGVPFGDVYPHVPGTDAEPLKAWYCAQPTLPNKAARRPKPTPEVSSDLCPRCGGFMVRTGTCLTCQGCGESSGGCG